VHSWSHDLSVDTKVLGSDSTWIQFIKVSVLRQRCWLKVSKAESRPTAKLWKTYCTYLLNHIVFLQWPMFTHLTISHLLQCWTYAVDLKWVSVQCCTFFHANGQMLLKCQIIRHLKWQWQTAECAHALWKSMILHLPLNLHFFCNERDYWWIFIITNVLSKSMFSSVILDCRVRPIP